MVSLTKFSRRKQSEALKIFSLTISTRPEAKRSNHEQAENLVETSFGGLNSYLSKKVGMTCD